MARIGPLTISVTEMPQFRRLVEFVADVERFNETAGDDGLAQLLDEVREDLRRMHEGSA